MDGDFFIGEGRDGVFSVDEGGRDWGVEEVVEEVVFCVGVMAGMITAAEKAAGSVDETYESGDGFFVWV